MKRFLLLKNNFDDVLVVKDLFSSLVGNNLILDELDNYLLFTFEHDSILDIKSLFLSLQDELYVDVIGYVSSSDRLDEEKEIALDLINELSSGVYTLKEALFSLKNIYNKKKILAFILDSTGVDEDFILSFAEYDLNASKAAKAMYIHRNTMNYKLDKLLEQSGFDLRKFKDAYILYSLVK